MLSIDLKNAINGVGITNFSCLLFKLFLKADNQNFSKLTQVYPIEAAMVIHYRKTGQIEQNDLFEARMGHE